MKADRRHELQQNELADWLGEKIEALKPHAAQITLAIALVVLALLVGSWWWSGSSKATALNWSGFFAAVNKPRDREKALEDLIVKERGTPAALWAQLTLGDENARQGVAALFTDRIEAQKLLLKAQEAYKAVESAAASDPSLQGRARLGLGKVFGALCQPTDAQKYYEQAAASLKDTALGKAAAADAERMKRKDQIDMLAWFAAQTPKKPAPLPGFGGGIPGMPNDLPARPDISPPVVTPPSGLGLDNVGTANPTAPAPDLPKPDAGTTPPITPPAAPTTPPASEPKASETKVENPKSDDKGGDKAAPVEKKPEP